MKNFKTCFRALVRSLAPLKWRVAVSCLIGLLIVCGSLAFVWSSKRVVDIATGHLSLPLDSAVVLMAAVMLFQVICRVAASYWEGYVVLKAANERRAFAFDKVMRSAWNGQDKYHSGDTVNRLEDDIREVTGFLCVNLPECFATVVQLIAAATYLFVLAPSLAWILLFIMPVAVIGSRLFFKRMRALTGEIRAVDSNIQGHIQENIQQRTVVKTLGGLERVLSRLGILQKSREDKTVLRLNYAAIAKGFMSLGFSAGYALAFFWGVYGLRDGSVSYGLMVAFLQLVGQVQRPVADIARHIPAFIRALTAEERLLDVETMEQEERHGDIVFPGAPGVRLEKLSFGYEGRGKNVFTDLDFDFKPGTVTAITGETGSGKSTLIKVMMSLLKPTSGRVVLYSGDTAACGDGGMTPDFASGLTSNPDTRCNFMYVPQGNSLLSGTIRENLLLARSDASEEEMREALHIAAADFVLDLPKGLETQCSEIGRGLSEGQAQRIAIARALLRPGGILVLDEATSALDAGTELELLSRIGEKYKGRKTIICITHRPAATSYADSVLKF